MRANCSVLETPRRPQTRSSAATAVPNLIGALLPGERKSMGPTTRRLPGRSAHQLENSIAGPARVPFASAESAERTNGINLFCPTCRTWQAERYSRPSSDHLNRQLSTYAHLARPAHLPVNARRPRCAFRALQRTNVSTRGPPNEIGGFRQSSLLVTKREPSYFPHSPRFL